VIERSAEGPSVRAIVLAGGPDYPRGEDPETHTARATGSAPVHSAAAHSAAA